MIIFLDTEFTSLGVDMELISMGLVDMTGERELYIELSDFDPKTCSHFVLGEVLPHMGEMSGSGLTYHFGPLSSLQKVITDWASVYPMNSAIAVDHGFDWMWMSEALQADFPPSIAPKPFRLDSWTNAPGFEDARIQFHKVTGLPLHHALHDARSLRNGYLTANRIYREKGGKS